MKSVILFCQNDSVEQMLKNQLGPNQRHYSLVVAKNNRDFLISRRWNVPAAFIHDDSISRRILEEAHPDCQIIHVGDIPAIIYYILCHLNEHPPVPQPDDGWV
jgi:hypothetical protein